MKDGDMVASDRRVALAGLGALLAVIALPIGKFLADSGDEAPARPEGITVLRGVERTPPKHTDAAVSPPDAAANPHHSALLTITRQRYPSLRDMRVECIGTTCTIRVSSRGLIDPGERDAIFDVVNGGLEGAIRQRGYDVGARDTEVYGDGTTVVIFSATALG